MVLIGLGKYIGRIGCRPRVRRELGGVRTKVRSDHFGVLSCCRGAGATIHGDLLARWVPASETLTPNGPQRQYQKRAEIRVLLVWHCARGDSSPCHWPCSSSLSCRR